MKKALFVLLVSTLLFLPTTAFAGDAATIVLRSGAIVTVNNGYMQLEKGMREANRRDSENHYVEIKIEGSTFFVNLGEVALLCRDKCGSLSIERPRTGNR